MQTSQRARLFLRAARRPSGRLPPRPSRRRHWQPPCPASADNTTSARARARRRRQEAAVQTSGAPLPVRGAPAFRSPLQRRRALAVTRSPRSLRYRPRRGRWYVLVARPPRLFLPPFFLSSARAPVRRCKARPARRRVERLKSAWRGWAARARGAREESTRERASERERERETLTTRRIYRTTA